MPQTRPSILAGEWYPEDPDELKAMLRKYLDRIPGEKVSGKMVGLISPHAGYVYSGFTAAHGYRRLEGRSFDVVAVLSPFHSYPAGRYMIHAASAYETPLGEVPVARDLVERLKSEVAITEMTGESEHSIEIQLPFLQMTLKTFSILPIMVAGADVWNVEDMVQALVKILKGRSALLIASTDLHHLHSVEGVKAGDAEVAAALERFDLKGIRTVLAPDACTVCGKVPVSIVAGASQKLGAERLDVLYRSNSKDEYLGQYTGTYTVGYLSAAMTGK